MKIFNVEIFGSDADEFMNLSVIQKIDWINTHTNQRNEDLIVEFIENLQRGKDTNCLDCGNISKTDAVESKPTKRKLAKKQSARDNTKR